MHARARCPGRWRVGLSIVATALVACGPHEAADDAPARAPAPVREVTAAQALAGAHVPTLDPHTLDDAEIVRVIGRGPHCTFHYTRTGRPVLAVSVPDEAGAARGLVKLNGSLVALQSAGNASTDVSFVLAAAPVRLAVRRLQDAPPPQPGRNVPVAGEMLFTVGQDLEVGYGGFVACTQDPPEAAARH
jgi:hypothetical protein